MGIEEHPNKRRSTEKGGGPECGMNYWSPNPGGGAPLGIEECSPSGGAPKRGRVGKECGIRYTCAGGD